MSSRAPSMSRRCLEVCRWFDSLGGVHGAIHLIRLGPFLSIPEGVHSALFLPRYACRKVLIHFHPGYVIKKSQSSRWFLLEFEKA
jgi:hypothetical protein